MSFYNWICRVPFVTKAVVATALCAAVAGIGISMSSTPWAANTNQATSAPRGFEDLPPSRYSELVRQGYEIFTDTKRYAGRYTGNALSCSSCHLDAGKKPNAAPMWAAWGMYPAYLAKSDRVSTFEERVQQCFRFSLDGLPPPLDSHELRALVAYAQWLAAGQPVRVELPGRGFPTIARTGADPDPMRGKMLFVERCGQCHGASGLGKAGGVAGIRYPPVAGFQSFNKGSGMNRPDLLAGFIKANMPYQNPNLTDQEALDLAAWITRQERAPDPRKGLLSALYE